MNREITETYEENVKKLQEKMQRGDFSLTPSELYLLINDETIQPFFKSLVVNKKVNWNQLWEEIMNLYSTYRVNLGSFLSFVFEDNDQLMDEEVVLLISRWFIDHYHFDNFEQSKTLLPSEIYQSLTEEAYQKLISNPKTDQPIYLSNSVIQRLLEEGRYEIFTLDCHLPKDADIDFILDNFPFDKYPSNCMNEVFSRYYYAHRKGIATVIDSGIADRLSTQTILKLAEDSIITPQCVPYLVNRILNETTFGDVRFNTFRHIFTEEQKTQIIEHFKRVGRLDLALGIMSDDISIEKNSEDYNAILSEMKDGIAFRYFPRNTDVLLQDNDFLEAFVTSGSIDNFGSFSSLPMSEKMRILNLIFREILKGNPYYKKNAFGDFYSDYLFFPEESDIRTIDFDFYDESFLNHVIEMQNAEFQEKIMDMILKIDPMFLENLVNQKKYALFFKIFPFSSQDMFENLSENLQKKLVEAIDQNYLYLEYISKEILIERAIWHNLILLKALLYFPASREKIFEVLNVLGGAPYIFTEEVYEVFKEYFVETKGYNAAHLDALKERFGLKIIQYLEDENIATILKYDNNQFSRLLDLFSQQKMTIDQLRNAYDSVIQYGFPRQHPEIVNSFHNLILSIDQSFDSVIALLNQMEPLWKQIKTLSEQAQHEPNNESLLEYLKSLRAQYEELNKEFKKFGGPEIFLLDSKFYKKFGEEKKGVYAEIAKEYSNPFQLLRMIMSKIKANPEDHSSYLDMLHFITDYYIRVEREIYRAKHNMKQMASDLSLSSHVDSMDARSKLPKFLVSRKVYQEELEQELMSQELSLDLARACIDYFNLHELPKDISKEDFNKIKGKQKIVATFLKNKISQMSEAERQWYYTQMDETKWEYDVPESSTDFLRMLTGLNLKHLGRILSFDEKDEEAKLLYESLKKSLTKSLAIPDALLDFMQKNPINMEVDVYNLSAFISYYSEIYSAEKKKLSSVKKKESEVSFGTTNIFLLAEAYASVSSIYSIILGVEDARLIKSNPPDNSATRKVAHDERLREAITWTRQNYERMEVTVPTFNQTLDVTKTKKLQVIVGNFTNPCNLTHGERTGACMRIGGVGEGLFQFCLADRNGFHIRFQDPETGEYISRVSGFRNGNTVFLNELRYSCNPYLYSDEDIVEACKQIAQLMIERSQEDYERDGWMPIDNVILHKDYAAKSLPTQNLGISNVREGLTLTYCDVKRKDIVLATSRDDNALVPINFDKRRIPSYFPARDNLVEVHSTKEIVPYVRRIDAVQRLMAGENYEYLEFPIMDEKEVRYGFANHDWYLYVDAIGVIHEKIITADPEAKRELERARQKIRDYVLEKGESSSYVI